MQELPEYIDGLPNLCGSEQLIEAAIKAGRRAPVLLAWIHRGGRLASA